MTVPIIAALFAATLLTCLGVALALLGAAATTLTMHQAQAADAAYAARAGLSLASAEARGRADWSSGFAPGTPAERCASTGAFADTSMLPPSPWDGSAVDLRGLTSARQADSDAAAPPGIAGPVWCLFEYGPISRLVPSDAGRHPLYVAVWAAVGRDGGLLLHATALGTTGLRASAETSIRPAAGGAPAVRQATRTTR